MIYRYCRKIRKRASSRYPDPVPEAEQFNARIRRIKQGRGVDELPASVLIMELEIKKDQRVKKETQDD